MLARVLLGLIPLVVVTGQVTKHTVTGTVSNAATGEPIRRALVHMAAGQTQASSLTGLDGRFRFENVPEGQAIFSATKPGFLDPPNSGFVVTVDSTRTDFTFKLLPTARIVGRVIGNDGEPVTGVNVSVLAEQIIDGRKSLQTKARIATDEEGEYRFDEMTPGRFILFCDTHPVLARSWKNLPEVYVPVYYLDSPDKTSAQTLELPPGQELTVDFRLHQERGYTVSAQITGIPAEFHGSAKIEDDSRQVITFGEMEFDLEHGRVSMERVPSGNWLLVIEGMGQKGHVFKARRGFTVDHADINKLPVILEPNMTIPVTVNHSGGAEQQQESDGQNFLAMLSPVEEGRAPNYAATLSGDPPMFAIENVESGRYRFSFQSTKGECLESAIYGSTDLTRGDVLISGTAGAQPMVLNLTTRCAELRLLPKSDSPMAVAVVVPGSSFANSQVWFLAQGSVLNLAPGTYQVFGFNYLDGLEYSNAEVMRNYRGESIMLGAGERREIKVDLNERKGN